MNSGYLQRAQQIAGFVVAFTLSGSLVYGQPDPSLGHHFGVFRNATGDAVTAAMVTVEFAETTTLATIYSSDNPSDIKGNPFITDGSGNYDFWASPESRYKLTLSKIGVGSFVFDNLQVGVQPHASRHETASTDPLDLTQLLGVLPDGQRVEVTADGAGAVVQPSIDFVTSDIVPSVADVSGSAQISFVLSNGSVVETKIANGAVTSSKIANSTIVNEDVSGSAAISESKLALVFPTHSNANDPSTGEKSALQGSFGTPGGANKYVTDSDPRMTNSRAPTAHAVTHEDGGADEITISSAQIESINPGTDLTADLEEEAHKTEHQDGGVDEIDITGLSGVLGSAQKVEVLDGGSLTGTRPKINFIEGSNAELTITDDVGNNRVNVTVGLDPGGTVLDELKDADDDTGIQVEATADDDTINFRTSGIARMQVEANGDIDLDSASLYVEAADNEVGLGTSAPQATLHLLDNTASDIFLDSPISTKISFLESGVERWSLSSPGSTEDLTLDSSLIARTAFFIDRQTEDIGMGTGAPSENLHLFDTASLGMKIEATGVNDSASVFLKNGAANWELKTRTDERFSITYVDTGNSIFRIDDSPPADSLFIESTGDIGMGTASPTEELHILGDSSTGAIIQSSGVDSDAFFAVSNDARRWEFGVVGADNLRIFDRTGSLTPFRIAAGAPTDTFSITAGGSVGIGTTSPDNKLEVNAGDIIIDDAAGTTRALRIRNLQRDWKVEVNGTSGVFTLRDNTGSTTPVTVSTGASSGSLSVENKAISTPLVKSSVQTLELPLGAFSPGGETFYNEEGNLVATARTFLDGEITNLVLTIPKPEYWDAGKVGFKMFLHGPGSCVGNTVMVFSLRAVSVGDSAPSGSVIRSTTGTLACDEEGAVFVWDQSSASGSSLSGTHEILHVRMTREGTNGADTNTGAIVVVGIRLYYIQD